MFADFALARLTDPVFVGTTLIDSVGGLAVLAIANAGGDTTSYTSIDSVTVRKVDFALPLFQTGATEETTLGPEAGSCSETRGRHHRMGSVVWVDALCHLRLVAQSTALSGPVTSVNEESLFDRLGDQPDMASLEAAIGTIAPPAEAAGILQRLGITSIADYRSGFHRITDVSAGPAPNVTSAETVDIDLVVSILTASDWRDNLRTAALVKSVLDREAAFDASVVGRQAKVPAAHVAVLSDNQIIATPINGMTPAESRTAIAALFASAGHLVHFEPDP